MRDDETGSTTTSGVGRRTVIRTAAWAVPAVSVVAATPAFAAACSPGADADLSSSTLDSFTHTAGSATYTFTVTLVDTGVATQGLTVSASGSSGTVTFFQATNGWGNSNAPGSKAATSQLACGGTKTTTFTVKFDSVATRTVSLFFSTTNTPTATYTASFTA